MNNYCTMSWVMGYQSTSDFVGLFGLWSVRTEECANCDGKIEKTWSARNVTVFLTLTTRQTDHQETNTRATTKMVNILTYDSQSKCVSQDAHMFRAMQTALSRCQIWCTLHTRETRGSTYNNPNMMFWVTHLPSSAACYVESALMCQIIRKLLPSRSTLSSHNKRRRTKWRLYVHSPLLL